MTERSPRNTRQHRRMTVRILVDYQTRMGIRCDYATTLGAGGMFLQTELPLSRGDVVRVRFRIPGGETLHELEARVKWSQEARKDPEGQTRSPGVGLQFLDPSATATLARELDDYAGF